VATGALVNRFSPPAAEWASPLSFPEVLKVVQDAALDRRRAPLAVVTRRRTMAEFRESVNWRESYIKGNIVLTHSRLSRCSPPSDVRP
jgi:hypothetical protein